MPAGKREQQLRSVCLGIWAVVLAVQLLSGRPLQHAASRSEWNVSNRVAPACHCSSVKRKRAMTFSGSQTSVSTVGVNVSVS